ncbi:MAG: hypothetical protein NVV66_08435 [Cellulomonas sp.]|uniref:hypothetical protein n=1 Tax=Cellulomonas sp. TaxID=40001 RepID=UPI002590D964|nr:hypothetical protein [Cellulomonas sp.]MCR6704711.1 hypothetical protein [Cellulomonas sp.]
MRNALLFFFPDVFESIVNDDHKSHIRDAFALVIGGPSGTSGRPSIGISWRSDDGWRRTPQSAWIGTQSRG